MTIVPVEVMIKAPLSPDTLRTHLIVSASHAAVDRQKKSRWPYCTAC
jgi:hypothetical protein